MKKASIAAAISLVLSAAAFPLNTAAEEDFLSSEEKAKHAHELSQSDMMYQQEDFRAMYYQNEAIIQLLKEIREEMHAMNLRDAKESKKA